MLLVELQISPLTMRDGGAVIVGSEAAMHSIAQGDEKGWNKSRLSRPDLYIKFR
jgi:hypothetical protein